MLRMTGTYTPEMLSNVADTSTPLHSHCGIAASVRRKARAPAAAWAIPTEAMGGRVRM